MAGREEERQSREVARKGGRMAKWVDERRGGECMYVWRMDRGTGDGWMNDGWWVGKWLDGWLDG